MNRYIDPLREVGQAMLDLAGKLDRQRAQPLSLPEKKLIRLAVAPTVRKELIVGPFPPLDSFVDAVMARLLAGKSLARQVGEKSPILAQIFGDLKD